MSVTAERKQEIIEDNARAKGDTGSPECLPTYSCWSMLRASTMLLTSVRVMTEPPGNGIASMTFWTDLMSKPRCKYTRMVAAMARLSIWSCWMCSR